jgi:hypothetical protein
MEGGKQGKKEERKISAPYIEIKTSAWVPK